MQHLTATRLAGIVATGGLVMAALAAPSAALASKPTPAHQVTICHATDSDSNPYVRITVDVASTGELERGHSGHGGPVWNATRKAAHVKWGDIIPSYTYGDYTFPGQNLGDGGQAIWDAGCAVETGASDTTEPVQERATEDPATEDPATEDPGTLVDESPSAEPTPDPVVEEPAPDGEVVYDEGFVTPAPDSTPVGAILGATGRPDMTPPATDTLDAGAGTATGAGFQALLLVLAGLTTMVLALRRTPAVRR